MKLHPAAEEWLLSKIRTLGSLEDPVAERLFRGLVAVDQDKANELMKSMPNRFQTPTSSVEASQLLATATGSGTRGERAEALGRLLDSPFGRSPEVWPQIKVLATSAKEPWVRSDIMAHVYLSVELPSREFCQNLLNAYREDERLGVSEVRALLFGKLLKNENADPQNADRGLDEKVEDTLFAEISKVEANKETSEKSFIWFGALRNRDPLRNRDVISLVAPILKGSCSDDVKASAIDTLAPETLERMNEAARQTKDFQAYRDSTLGYVSSLYSQDAPVPIKEAIFSVYAKLGESYHVDQLTRWKEKDSIAGRFIEAAIEDIQSRR